MCVLSFDRYIELVLALKTWDPMGQVLNETKKNEFTLFIVFYNLFIELYLLLLIWNKEPELVNRHIMVTVGKDGIPEEFRRHRQGRGSIG